MWEFLLGHCTWISTPGHYDTVLLPILEPHLKYVSIYGELYLEAKLDFMQE